MIPRISHRPPPKSNRAFCIPVLVLALGVCFSVTGQAVESLEICGVPFRLGMTRQEVKEKLVLPPLPPGKGRDELWHTLLGGEFALLFAHLFGLPDTAECYGSLRFKADRVVEIERDVISTSDAVSLARALFLELRKMNEASGTSATVTTRNFTSEKTDDYLSGQYILFHSCPN